MAMSRQSGVRPLSAAVDRFATLAVRRGVSLGVLRSHAPGDFELVLAAAAQSLKAGCGYSEREVNELLRAYLDGAGAMLATDHVELRRWLVDFRVLVRDGFGRVYALGAPAGGIPDLIAQLAGIDLAAVARTARDADAAQRARRKARWHAAGRGSTT